MDFPKSEMRRKPIRYATEKQKDFILDMLDEMGESLKQYTDTPLNELTIEAASEVIDEIKADRDFLRDCENDYESIWKE